MKRDLPDSANIMVSLIFNEKGAEFFCLPCMVVDTWCIMCVETGILFNSQMNLRSFIDQQSMYKMASKKS